MNSPRATRSIACRAAWSALLLAVAACGTGCIRWRTYASAPLPMPGPPPAIGQAVDAYTQRQEEAGEAHDFIVYDHEFYDDSARLTADGEDHLRQIAARAGQGNFPIIIQQSKTTAKPDTKYEYPIMGNADLDLQRAQVVSRLLTGMGVGDAHTRVVIGPALAPGFTAVEGERAYSRGVNGGGLGSGFGGGFGGLGGGRGGFGGGFRF